MIHRAAYEQRPRRYMLMDLGRGHNYMKMGGRL